MALEINNWTGMLIKNNTSTKKTDGTRTSTEASLTKSVTGSNQEAAELNISVDSFVKSKNTNEDATGNDASGKGAAAQNQKSLLDVSKADKFGVTKLSESERTELVSQLKDQQEAIQAQFLKKMTQGTLGEQFRQWSAANSELTQDGDGIWKFIASGNYTVDAETKAAAEAAISEGGYYSVEKTSQRIFDFVAAMAGDNPAMMQKLQSAVYDGYKEATKAWGGELPEISKKTLEATNKLFEDYYKEKGLVTE